MKIEPKMYIATGNISGGDFRHKCRASGTYQLTRLSFDLEKQSFIGTSNLRATVVFKGDLTSLLQYSDNSIMVCGYYEAIIVDSDKMN